MESFVSVYNLFVMIFSLLFGISVALTVCSVILDKNHNKATVTLIIDSEEISFDESWLVGYNEEAILKDEYEAQAPQVAPVVQNQVVAPQPAAPVPVAAPVSAGSESFSNLLSLA